MQNISRQTAWRAVAALLSVLAGARDGFKTSAGPLDAIGARTADVGRNALSVLGESTADVGRNALSVLGETLTC